VVVALDQTTGWARSLCAIVSAGVRTSFCKLGPADGAFLRTQESSLFSGDMGSGARTLARISAILSSSKPASAAGRPFASGSPMSRRCSSYAAYVSRGLIIITRPAHNGGVAVAGHRDGLALPGRSRCAGAD
jgi:hypothetical protein